MITQIIYFALFLISVGAVSGSFLISNYLRKSYPVGYIESYFYYVVLMCVFGIYGIWGLIFINRVFSEIEISNEIAIVVSQLIPFLGFPFLIIAWFMFIKFSYEVGGTKISPYVSISYFIFLLSFFISIGWSILNNKGENNASSELSSFSHIYIYIVLDLFFTLWGLVVIRMKSKHSGLKKSEAIFRYFMIFLSLLILKISSVILFFFYEQTIPVFILLYFLSIILPLVYFYNKINSILNPDDYSKNLDSSAENILSRYGITKREREIVEEVCAGKSNQEIADSLFISLQTVKDHTHRIYLKMDIKNRMQLIKMMQAVSK